MTEEELQPLVDSWREANPNIVRFWWDVDRAVKDCIRQRVPTETHGLHFDYRSAMLFITLPSGRRLAYVKPRIGENQFGGESVTYMGVGGTKKWERLESYGPKFVENIVQGTARDILCYAMQTLKTAPLSPMCMTRLSSRPTDGCRLQRCANRWEGRRPGRKG